MALMLLSPAAQAGHKILTYAGSGISGTIGDGTGATSASITNPDGVAVDSSGNVYIADTGNYLVRAVATNGNITRVAGNETSFIYAADGISATSTYTSTEGVSVDSSGNIYIADQANNRIRKVSVGTGLISTVAGGSGVDTGDDIAATSAKLFNPMDVYVHASGSIFIADTASSNLRMVDLAGNIHLLAGWPTRTDHGYNGDNADATTKKLKNPRGVFVAASGDIYIADTGNNRIRKIHNGIITTVAGDGTASFGGDGALATSAQLNSPYDVVVDAVGNIYIADTNNHRVRKVDIRTGNINTLCGTGTPGYNGDLINSTAAQLNAPMGLALDADGNLFVSDDGNNRIRVITNDPPSVPTSLSGRFDTIVGDSDFYSCVSTDPDGDMVKYVWDWKSDGLDILESDFTASGTTYPKSRAWGLCDVGAYNLRVKAVDENGSESGWMYKLYTITDNAPYWSSTPTGAASGLVGASLSYSVGSKNYPGQPDPDVDCLTNPEQVQFGWDWDGNGTADEWSGLLGAGVLDSRSHSWSTPGTYLVKVIVRDSLGTQSSWSSTKTVVIASNPSAIPTQPSGTGTGYVNTSLTYVTSASDPDGNKIRYGWDFDGDGTVDEWSGLVNSGTADTRSKTWLTAGTYLVKVKSEDSFGEQSGWSTAKSVVIDTGIPPNHAPATPFTPSGPDNGSMNTALMFSASATDVDGNELRYGWDWNGDGTVEDWSRTMASGTADRREKIWSKPGVYSIRVKAEDSNGAQSAWSEAKTVTIGAPAPAQDDHLYVYPHPMKCPGGNIVFKMERAGKATLQVFNLRGQVIKEIVQELAANPSATVPIMCTEIKSGVYLIKGEIKFVDGTTKKLKPYKFVVTEGK